MIHRILFADDNPDTRQLVKLIFTARLPGTVVSLAQDGTAAVDMVRRGIPFDLVLLDYQMPPDGDGGIWAATRICRMLPAVPVFFLSAYTLERTMPVARATGAWGYLCKDSLAHREIFEVLIAGDWNALRRSSHKHRLFEENIRRTVSV